MVVTESASPLLSLSWFQPEVPQRIETCYRQKGESDTHFLLRLIRRERWCTGDQLELVAKDGHIVSAKITHRGEGAEGVATSSAPLHLVARHMLRYFGYGSLAFTFADGVLVHDQLTILGRANKGETWNAFSDRLWASYRSHLHDRYLPDEWQIAANEVRSDERSGERTTVLVLQLRDTPLTQRRETVSSLAS